MSEPDLGPILGVVSKLLVWSPESSALLLSSGEPILEELRSLRGDAFVFAIADLVLLSQYLDKTGAPLAAKALLDVAKSQTSVLETYGVAFKDVANGLPGRDQRMQKLVGATAELKENARPPKDGEVRSDVMARFRLQAPPRNPKT